MKLSGNENRINKMTETRIRRDLKELIERHGSIFRSLTTVEELGGKSALQRFFADEMNLTKKTLNTIVSDVEASHFKDSKVRNKFYLCIVDLQNIVNQNFYHSQSFYYFTSADRNCYCLSFIYYLF